MNTAFLMGRKSFIDGKFNHPYRKDTILAKEWQRGWTMTLTSAKIYTNYI